MAKRKRLTPAQSDYLEAVPAGLETKSMGFPARAPIAQVAGEAASAAALEEMAGEIRRARDEGRMIQALPIGAVDIGYLTRDRIEADTAELDDLVASIRERGQQTPIEVVALDGDRYGLISGWRRLTALKRIYTDTRDERYSTVLAILRRPDTASDAYVAMVEENEVRLGLSYYERARIVAKSIEQGVYAAEKEALSKLFSTASRTKRSKIKSFLALYRAADDLLRHPGAINERLGVALSRELLDSAANVDFLREALAETREPSAEDELKLLQQVLDCLAQRPSLNPGLETKTKAGSTSVAAPAPEPAPSPQTGPDARPQGEELIETQGPYKIADGVHMIYGHGHIKFQGRNVTREMCGALMTWVMTEYGDLPERPAED